MQILQILVVGYFALSISIEDLRIQKIRNRKLFHFLTSLILFSVLLPNAGMDLIAGASFLALLTVLYLASNALHKSGGIGFGDVKLTAVLALAFFDSGLRSFEIFFVSLWLAVLAHICLYFLMYRKVPHRIAMAPDIFLASGLYLYAPIGLLLPQ